MPKKHIIAWTVAIVAVVLAVSLWKSIFGKKTKESYGASNYGWFASDVLSHLPDKYVSVEAARVILTNVVTLYEDAASSYSDPVPCATVCDYVSTENAFEGVEFRGEWQQRRANDALKRLLHAVHGENCLGGFVTFKEAAGQVRKLVASV